MFLDIDKKEQSKTAAIDDSGKKITYGELVDFSNEIKQLISERTLIFILSENTIGSMAMFVGCLDSKVVPLLLNGAIDKEFLTQLILVYKPEYLWVSDDKTNEFENEVIFSKFGYSLLKSVEEKHKLFDDLAMLLPTSGSTGGAKLVRHSYKNIEANSRNVSFFFELTENERAIAALPIYYTMGLSVITSHLFAGATLILTKRSLIESEFWTFIKNEKATSFTGVPYSFEMLARLRFFRMELPHLKLITQGGGKMREDLFTAFAEYAEKNGKKFIATYGQTEGTARMAYLPAEFASKKICSIGKAIPNGELLLVDEDGKEIKETESQGQLVFKGANVTLGYAYNIDDLSKGDENNSVLYTGDIAGRDSEGFYYIIGRKSRFLKLFGVRISLDDCENLIKTEFKTECACTGNDSKMKIFIINEQYVKPVKDFIIEKLNLLNTAFSVNVIDNIPKSEAGKVLYSELDKN